jgi:hypothetical protein
VDPGTVIITFCKLAQESELLKGDQGNDILFKILMSLSKCYSPCFKL